MRRRALLILSIAFVGLVSQVHAADADPTGTWKWTVTNPTNNQTRDLSAKLKLDGDKLTGSVPGQGGKEIAIENGTFKDGQVSFTVTRERNDQKVVTKFSGKLEGDTITGKTENERPNGKPQTRDWVAKREKA
jgi:hypothetical protein